MSSVGDAGFGRAFRALRFTGSTQAAVPASLIVIPPNPWPGDAHRGRTMLAGTIALGGESISVEGSPWNAAASEPWSKALHGFGWLRDLRAVGGDAARRHARLLTTQWLDRKPRQGDMGLRADVTGARIANWIAFHDFFCASADDRFRGRFFAALTRQSRGLAKALPGDLSGAPLLFAIKGLLASALCLEGGEQRFAWAEKLLLRELPRQILADGVQAERCPGIHAETLIALIDMRALYKAARIMMPDPLRDSIDRMVPALRFFRHGDGGLALFNGSQEDEALLLDTILTQADARARPMKQAREAGFERMSLGRSIVLVDSGAPASPGFDRCAHAGIGSFEMSVGRQRFIVNCGGYPGSGPWRKALAATAAHSTLTVADTNQVELIEGGGVRRRPPSVETHREDSAEGMLLKVSHNGYAGLGLIHRRLLFLGESGEDLRGEDILTGSAAQRFTVRFHLHPDVQASLTGCGQTVLLRLGDGSGWKFRADTNLVVLEESVYLGCGFSPRRTNALVISGHTEKDADSVVRWSFRREKRSGTSPAE